jgi:hypothetical protein
VTSNAARATSAGPWAAAAALAALFAYSVMTIAHGGALPPLTAPTLGSSDVRAVEADVGMQPSASGPTASVPPGTRTADPAGGATRFDTVGEALVARSRGGETVVAAPGPPALEPQAATEEKRRAHPRGKERRARAGKHAKHANPGLAADRGRASGRRHAAPPPGVPRASSAKAVGNTNAKPSRAQPPRGPAHSARQGRAKSR